jgi:hypothetical protein
MPLAQSEGETIILRNLTRSWVMIANQTDRYEEELMNRAAGK